MASDNLDTIKRASALLREGRVQEADDLLTASARQIAAEASPGVPPPPPAPREPLQVVYAMLALIGAHLGNPPGLSRLVDELASVL